MFDADPPHDQIPPGSTPFGADWASLYRDLLSGWMAYAQRSIARGIPSTPGGAPDPMASLFAMAFDAWQSQPGIGPSSSSFGHKPDGGAYHLIGLIAQAQLVCMASATRYATRLADIYRTEGTRLANDLAAASADSGQDSFTLPPLVEESRAYLRRITEIALQEARTFEVEMTRIEEAMRALIDDGSNRESANRYWKAKS